MQVLERSQALAIAPLWRLGFRPFFLGGALFALLAMAAWVAALNGWLAPQPLGGEIGPGGGEPGAEVGQVAEQNRSSSMASRARAA